MNVSVMEELERHLEELAGAQIERNRAKEALELARARALLSGAIGGKNAEEREAQARSTLQEAYRALEAAEERLIWARARAETARARFELAKEGKLSLAEEKARLEARLLEVEEVLSIERAEMREVELTRQFLEEYENQDERGR
ncbi:hypothetical protein [Meiothermus sp. Pnk-1]|uniref:hypothetical protein n=1 Tax=Meiothermus sp. Pnk-1 TaxID=873128 RepID=UPI0018F2118A|nr:hypothetical protein [Meiothermus sp. Pnk-1]